MGVSWFKEITGRGATKDVDTNKRYTRTFQVRTDTPQDGASVVLAYAEVPAFNDPYSYTDDSNPAAPVVVTDTQAVCVDIRIEQENPDDPRDWIVRAEYAGVDDPTAQPADVEYSPTRYQKALVDDASGNPVVNSAGDPFEDGITVDRTRFTLVITKAVLTFDPVDALTYQDTLNQGVFLAATHPPGFDAGTCKLTLGAKRVRRAGTSTFYWIRRAEIDIDRDGWKIKPRDAGFRALAGGVPVPIIDAATGAKPSTPVLLDGAGARLLPGDPPKIAGPTLNGFDGYTTKDWTPLGLEY